MVEARFVFVSLMQSNEMTVRPFGPAGLKPLVQKAVPGFAVDASSQIDYLDSYLQQLGATTVVSESHYVDRHYIEEYATYYSRMLSPPPNHVARLHFFRDAFDDGVLDSALSARVEGGGSAAEIRTRLDAGYLGFISIRPLPAVPIGRTVLKRIPDSTESKREIWATTQQTVHLGSLELRVDGIAFQQQDVAVGACATAALWSALSSVSRSEGMRAPTPSEITAFASRNSLPFGRAIPAGAGLTIEQLSEAIRLAGFAPEHIRADAKPELFVLALHTYLLSGIPVVLELFRPECGHAVTAVGFHDSGSVEPAFETLLPVRSARMKKVYVHDDRLGPYARAYLSPLICVGEFERLRLHIENELWLLNSAVVPVYPKLRLSVDSFVRLADRIADLVEAAAGPVRAKALAVEFYYKRGGAYLAKLPSTLPRAAVAKFCRSVVFSRWIGVIRWTLADETFVEFIYDTTDIVRGHGEALGNLLRGVVAFDPASSAEFKQLSTRFGVPFLGCVGAV